MVRARAGNRSRRMAGVLLGTPSGIACGGAAGVRAMCCCGRMWANVALCWARNVEEALTTIGGVMTRNWAPLVQLAVNMAQSGLMCATMSNLLALLQSRGHTSHGVSGTARMSGRRQNGMIAALGMLCLVVVKSTVLTSTVPGGNVVVAESISSKVGVVKLSSQSPRGLNLSDRGSARSCWLNALCNSPQDSDGGHAVAQGYACKSRTLICWRNEELLWGSEVGMSYFWSSVGVTSSSCLVLLVRRAMASRSAISYGVHPCKREVRVADIVMVLPQSSKDG
eukprot:12227057-Ditylum_brightwellii.AAC.1